MNPEWVIVGFRQEDQFVLLASKTMLQTELETVYKHPYGSSPWDWFSPSVEYFRLGASITNYVKVAGDSYRQCIRILMTNWNPDQAPLSTLLDKAHLELEKGRE